MILHGLPNHMVRCFHGSLLLRNTINRLFIFQWEVTGLVRDKLNELLPSLN